MPSCNRLLIATIRGCLIAGVFLAPATSWGQTEQIPAAEKPEGPGIFVDQPPTTKEAEQQPAEEETTPQTTAQPAAPEAEERAAPPPADPQADERAEREKADLVAQQQMAAATDEMAKVAWAQFVVSAFGALLLLWTLHLTRVSAKAGRDAARATDEAVLLAKSQHERLERPYLYASGVFRLQSDHEGGATVSVEVANHGKLPAIIEDCWEGMISTKDADPPLPLRADESHMLFRDNVVPADGKPQKFKIRSPAGLCFIDFGNQVHPHMPGEDVFVVIRLQYSGPFTKGHVTSACWRWRADGKSAHFVLHGGAEWNYTK